MPSFRGTVSDSIFEVASWKLANKPIQIGIFIFKNVFGEYVNFLSITMSPRALRKVQRFIAAVMSPLIAHSLIITASLLTDILIIFLYLIIYFLSSQCFPSGLLSLTDDRAGAAPGTRLLTPARVTQPPVSHLPSLSAG